MGSDTTSRPAPRHPGSVSLVPPQHGAWAFLGLPIVLGLTVGGISWQALLLSLGFVVAYPASYFTIAFLRYPRRQRFVRGLAIWAIPGALIALVAVAQYPWLLWVGLAYLIAFGVNLAFAKAHDERNLVNDAVFIAECVAIVPILWAVSASDGGWLPPNPADAPASLWVLTAFTALALIGSTLHVRSLIRERRNPAFARVSQVFAAVSLVVAVALAWPAGAGAVIATALAFGFMLLRSAVMYAQTLKPGVIGVVELVGFILIAVAGLVVNAGLA